MKEENDLLIAKAKLQSAEMKLRTLDSVHREVCKLLGVEDGDGLFDRIQGLLKCEREMTTMRWKESRK